MELVFLTLAIVVVGMYIYRTMTRKKKEREFFPEDFNKDGSEKYKNEKD